ncbi:unnamed protein product [Anisakis simplex]|uniref:Uncharacterized protein n=1 Tax=Anisakis simplex TaxID=6269 RepID=A0A0M3JKZ5_ANISI|nr:unnamed protein product [Anisakis simplex]
MKPKSIFCSGETEDELTSVIKYEIAFDAGDFGAHMDAGEGDSSEEEDAEGTSSGEEEGQEDDDEETDSGDDHESDPGDEYEDERLERERMIERAKTSDRFVPRL